MRRPVPRSPTARRTRADSAVDEARTRGDHLVLASDPDCDRLGAAAPLTTAAGAAWQTFTGNQIAALLVDRVLATRGVRGTTATPFRQASFRATRRDKSVFVFLPQWPGDRDLLLPAFDARPTRYRLMGDAAWQSPRAVEAGTIVRLPERPANPVCSVIEVETA